MVSSGTLNNIWSNVHGAARLDARPGVLSYKLDPVQKPSLADYSITPETLERVEAVEWKARAWIGWTSFVVYLTAFYYFDLSINFLILTIWSFPILYVCLRPLLDLCFEIVWSDSRKVHNYKKALEKYQWRTLRVKSLLLILRS
jgi:hypothetical protein